MMNNERIIELAEDIVKKLPVCESNKIDTSHSIVCPFRGKGPIKLFIIGQDPTIRNVNQRKNVSVTLNLDKAGVLRHYIGHIVEGLGLSFDNVYATNLFKYFYTIPPAETPEVLFAHLQPNVNLLKEELAEYENCTIITLGEPVLQLLTKNSFKVHDYWNYHDCGFHYVEPAETILSRYIFPFPHQPSLSKTLYRDNLDDYIEFVKQNMSK